MKNFIQKIVTYYNQNARFHSFVITLEYAAVGFLVSYSGGVPTSKSGWAALASGLAGAVIGSVKRWLATNVATDGLDMKK